MKKINIILHYPKDAEAICKLQYETNVTYIKSVEKLLKSSHISIEDRKLLLDMLLLGEKKDSVSI